MSLGSSSAAVKFPALPIMPAMLAAENSVLTDMNFDSLLAMQRNPSAAAAAAETPQIDLQVAERAANFAGLRALLTQTGEPLLPCAGCDDGIVEEASEAVTITLIPTTALPGPAIPSPAIPIFAVLSELSNSSTNSTDRPAPSEAAEIALVAPAPPKLIFAAGDHTVPAAITPQSSAAIVPRAQDLFAGRQLDLARDQLWLGQLASDIVAARGTDDRISFRLLPEKLGRLYVELTSHETGLSVKIEASTDDAAKLLASAQSRLVDELRMHSVRVSSAEVTHSDLSRQDKRPHPQAAQAITEFRAPDTAKPEKTKAVQRDGRFA